MKHVINPYGDIGSAKNPKARFSGHPKNGTTIYIILLTERRGWGKIYKKDKHVNSPMQYHKLVVLYSGARFANLTGHLVFDQYLF